VSPTVGDIAESVMKKGRSVAKTIVHFGSPEGTKYGDKDTSKIVIIDGSSRANPS
jgi:hypothetical protein